MPNPMFQTLMQLALQNKFAQDRAQQQHQWDLEKLSSQQQQQEKGWENILSRQQQMEELKSERDRMMSEQAGTEFGPSLNAAITSAYGPESAIPDMELQKLGKFASRLSPKDQQQLHNNLLDSHKAAYTAQNSIRSPQIHTIYDEASGRNKLIGTAYDLKTKKFITQDINYYDKESDLERDKKLLVNYINNPESLDEKQTTRAKLLYGKYINDVTKMVTTQNTDQYGAVTTDVTAATAPQEPGGSWNKQVVARGRTEIPIMTPQSKTEVEKVIRDERGLEDTLLDIKDKAQDKFLTYGGGAEAFAKRIYGKMFNPREKDKYMQEYAAWKQDVSAMENDYLHLQTGSQRAMAEIKWLQDAIANPNISPVEFSTRLNGMINASRRRRTRHEEYRLKGFSGEHMERRMTGSGPQEQTPQNTEDLFNTFLEKLRQ